MVRRGIYRVSSVATLLWNMVCRLPTVTWHCQLTWTDREHKHITSTATLCNRLQNKNSFFSDTLKSDGLGVLNTEHWSTLLLLCLTWQDLSDTAKKFIGPNPCLLPDSRTLIQQVSSTLYTACKAMLLNTLYKNAYNILYAFLYNANN